MELCSGAEEPAVLIIGRTTHVLCVILFKHAELQHPYGPYLHLYLKTWTSLTDINVPVRLILSEQTDQWCSCSPHLLPVVRRGPIDLIPGVGDGRSWWGAELVRLELVNDPLQPERYQTSLLLFSRCVTCCRHAVVTQTRTNSNIHLFWSSFLIWNLHLILITSYCEDHQTFDC